MERPEVDHPYPAAGHLNSDEFATVYKELTTRPEIYFLLVRSDQFFLMYHFDLCTFH